MTLSDVRWDDVRSDTFYPLLNDTFPHVLCGECALYRAGINSQLFSSLQMWTEYKELETVLQGLVVTYYYIPVVDLDYEVAPVDGYKNILLPSKERALVEMIKYRDYFNEGSLIEGLQTYLWLNGDDLDHLYEVAVHFKVSQDEIDYWINEAREDDYTCG